MSSFPPSNYEQRVWYANQSGKIFRMSESYGAPQIRKALVKRGYIEQKAIPYNSIYFNINCALQMDRCTVKDLKEYEQVVIYRVIGKQLPHFVWVARQQHYNLYKSACKLNRININGLDFTVKDDLCIYISTIAEQQKHHHQQQIEHLRLTRSYDWHRNPEKVSNDFEQDYRIGCILGLILYVNKRREQSFKHPNEKECTSKLINLKAIDLAMHAVVSHIRAFEGLAKLKLDCELTQLQWSFICRAHRLITTGESYFKTQDCATTDRYIARIKMLAEVIPDYWPERVLDGDRCIYLLKPVGNGNGLGIVLLNTNRKIMLLATNKKKKYIIQK